MELFIIIFSALCFMFLIVGIKGDIDERKRVNEMTAEEREEYDKKQEKLKQERKKNNEIDYTIIVGGDSRKSVGSSVTRGAIGGALLGPVGLVGGALSGKNKSKTTFTIVYKSGRREVKTVDNNSWEFDKYAKYVK